LGFEPIRQSQDWCAARGEHVGSLHYTLTRAKAGFAPVRRSWSAWLGLEPIRSLTAGP
jgi:hypothetical protein